jgi:hypothetical protein
MVSLLVIGIIVNALIGAFLFSKAWKQLQPILNCDEEVSAKYPSFRRMDVAKWKKFKFFLGAITIMPLRFLIGIIILSSLFVFVK